jgi:hypothetical protein
VQFGGVKPSDGESQAVQDTGNGGGQRLDIHVVKANREESKCSLVEGEQTAELRIGESRPRDDGGLDETPANRIFTKLIELPEAFADRPIP